MEGIEMITSSRELFPAERDETGKVHYHYSIPVVPVITPDGPPEVVVPPDFSRCFSCGLLWLFREMGAGECPGCRGIQPESRTEAQGEAISDETGQPTGAESLAPQKSPGDKP